MSEYQTRQLFGDFPARVSDSVVLACVGHKSKPGEPPIMCLRAGVVGAISSSRDKPYLRDMKVSEVDKDPDEWEFIETTSVEEIQAMKIGQWTWPLERSEMMRTLKRFVEEMERIDDKREPAT